VVLPAWEQFIQEEELHDIIETITKTSVCRTAYCFKNYGKKEHLHNHLIDQINGNIGTPSLPMLSGNVYFGK
jgi:hypothetical protein